jgi:hypothetical protein
MNRIGVVLDVIDTAVPSSFDKGDLVIADTKGGIVEPSATGPYTPPTMLEVFVGLSDGSAKQVGTINPAKFNYVVKQYEAAVGKTVRVGYTGSTGKLVCIDPTVSTNVTKFGTLTLTLNSLISSAIPGWGDMFQRDIQIVTGDTNTTLYAKLQAAATAIATAINTKYGSGTVTFTSGAPVLNASSSYLQFVFAANKHFVVTLDGIFDGTPITVTAGGSGPFISGMTGVEVREKEMEAAILDGYNPNQKSKYASFDLENYVQAAVGTNYDAIEITTTLPKEYESPDAPTGWDVSFTLFSVTGDNALGAIATEIQTLLAEIKSNNQALSAAAADALFLTEDEADALYEPLT